MIESVERGRDKLIRMVDVRYQNYGETQPRITSQTVRQLIKLWSVEDQHMADDLAELDRKFKQFGEQLGNDVLGQEAASDDGNQAVRKVAPDKPLVTDFPLLIHAVRGNVVIVAVKLIMLFPFILGQIY